MILDTNALSAIADGEPAIMPMLKSARAHQLPVIVLGEYRYGLLRSRERAARERWLDELESLFEVLEPSAITARHYARIREDLRQKGTPIPENDIWIAALAVEYDLEVASRDEHFDRVREIRRRGW